MENQVIAFFAYCAPAIIVGVVAYYFFYTHTKNEDNRRRFLLQKENQKLSLPLRLQAYERMVLFLERINPQKQLLRLPAASLTKKEYELLLIRSIEEEFEHNMSQQIYMSEELWNVIKTAKLATIQIIRKAAQDEALADAHAMTESIFKEFIDKATPSSSAIGYLKEELKTFL
ncbi:hypothetical protein ACI76Q_03545 [Capnocytophaga canimorsus]|uniref:DUF7935 family protein n=1 Tax=Capnocytophaga canimorsus TaxID=28188 RepID=UPI000F6CE800|nr:hypothetical protein [Capnocytophaga canimorsus]VEJ18627.1 Uncharacterised protein [Capnocytophaga canimorsus]